MDSLFTNIQPKEAIDYILKEIYVKRKMKPIYMKIIFNPSLYKLTAECTFRFATKFFKQIDFYLMGGPLCVTLLDTYMTRTENNAVRPQKLLFYRRSADDIINRKKKNKGTILFLGI